MVLTLQTIPGTIRSWRRVTAMVNRWMALQTAGASWEINREGNKDMSDLWALVFNFHFAGQPQQ